MRVMLFGTFDRLHPGHRFVIEEARKRGAVTVIVARDQNVMKIKGHAPLQSEEERAEALRDAFPDITVLLGDKDNFLAPTLTPTLTPTLILLGYDQELPPGVTEDDLPCPVERLPAFEPEKWKSSLLRKENEEIEEVEENED